MNLEEILIVLGVAVIVWMAGYMMLAIVFLVLFFFVAVISVSEPTKPKNYKEIAGVKIKGNVDVLEPIIIETRRTPPFRVPSKTYATIQAKGYKDIDRERYTTKLGYPIIKLLLALFGKGRKRS